MNKILLSFIVLLAGSAFAFSQPASPDTLLPIEVRGEEINRINMQLPDGGLKPVVGVQNIQIMRACLNKPELADGDGWTYSHHPDLAVWKGRLYAAWDMQPKHEDEGPYKVVYATSTDGFHWSAPADLFPRNIVLAARFYFYRATNDRMLAFTAFKYKAATVGEVGKSILLVREITADHQLGEVFTLLNLLTSTPQYSPPSSFETATDAGFVAACREAAENNLLLEQQDYGVYLGTNKIPWHDDPELSKGFWQYGKAFCFYHRQDSTLVGLSKMGWESLSDDNGATWPQRPMQPPTLFAGSGKIWGQRTTDSRYALVYNPNPKRVMRYPLAIVHGDDGQVFRDMRVVHGEVSKIRYGGQWKVFGPQYMRGLAEWADDGTFADRQAMWMIYSVAKEDIWVSRISLPIKPDETEFPTDDFANATPGGVVPGWNLYNPKWAPVTVVENAGKRSLELRDGDPFDYARAVRVFPESAKVRAELELTPAQTKGRLEIELCDSSGRRPVRVVLTETGRVQAADGKIMTDLGNYTSGNKLSLVIAADAAAGRYSVQVNGSAPRVLATAETSARTLHRLSLRTGTYRVFGDDVSTSAGTPSWDGLWREKGESTAVNPAADEPSSTPAVFQVQRVIIAIHEFSSDASLTDLTVNDTTVRGFDPAVLSYVVDVDGIVSIPPVPVVAAMANFEGATVTVTQAENLQGTEAQRTATVNVLAEDKISMTTYKLIFKLITSHEYSSDATLADLTVDSTTVRGFDPAVLSYVVDVDGNVSIPPVPLVVAIANFEGATVTLTQAENLQGTEAQRTATVNVLAEDNISMTTYKIVFNLITGMEKTPNELLNIYAEGKTICIRTSGIGMFNQVKVYNLDGKKIIHKNLTSTFERIQVTDPSGMYIVKVKSEEKTVIEKLILR